MKKRKIESYERYYLILITFIVLQIFLIFFNIYNTQQFPIEDFTIVIIQLIVILLSYFIGMIPAAVFSIIYIVGYIAYMINVEGSITVISYILMFFVPLLTIYAGNMNIARKEIINDLVKLYKLEEIELKIDSNTNLENENAFKEILSKHNNLANRYSNYYFSMHMFRLEFIDTIRILLDVKEFSKLLEKIARIIESSIREEDYKFIVNNNRFIVITPLTSSEAFAPAVRRILENVKGLDIIDKNGEKLNIVLKTGGIDSSRVNYEIFKNHSNTIKELQKATEVDIHGEYFN